MKAAKLNVPMIIVSHQFQGRSNALTKNATKINVIPR